MPSYAVPSGDRIYGGRAVTQRDPSAWTYQWPPDAADTIPAVDGDNAPIHPKVLDFGSAWNGYRYWMAFTPYPIGNDDTKENPSVVASTDGDTWVAPATNPIAGPPSGAATGTKYYSDTHLLYDGTTLYLIYRQAEHVGGNYNDSVTETLFFHTSTNGTTWSAQQTLLTSVSATGSKYLSPSLVMHGGEYWMFVAEKGSPYLIKVYKSSTIDGTYTLLGTTDISLTSPEQPWHIDVIRVANAWLMLINDRFGAGDSGLHMSWSVDGLSWTAPHEFTTSGPGNYRASLVRNGDSALRCWTTDFDARTIRQFTVTDVAV